MKKSKAEIVSIAVRRTLAEMVKILEEETKKGGDLFVLPEACLIYDADVTLEAMEAEAVAAVSAIARHAGVYICLPINRKGGSTGLLNSSFLFDRSGKTIGIYDKIYPFWEEFKVSYTPWNVPTAPGKDVCVVETDFGKVGMAICFDANFPSVFKRMAEAGVELVLWSSAYSGGMSLQAHAINHNIAIITSTWDPHCTVFDITGREILHRQGEVGIPLVTRHVLDFDRTIFHDNYNGEKRDRLLADHGDAVEMDCTFPREGWFTLRSTKDGVSVRALAAEYGMETLQSYKLRSEREIDAMRARA